MISFEPTEEQNVVRDMAAKIAGDVLSSTFQRADRDSQLNPDAMNALWSLGLVQAQLDARAQITNAIVLEELAARDAVAAGALATSMAFAQAVADHGAPAQRQWAQSHFASDDFQAAAIAWAEPRVAFDPAKLATTAKRDGDGFVLDGEKSLVPLAETATHFLVIADGSGAPAAFIVEATAPGVSVSPYAGTLGLRALRMANVKFSNVKLAGAARLGGEAPLDVARLQAASRIGASALMCGLSRAVYDYVVPYTKERVAHGTAVARKQSVAFRIADMHIEIEAMRWMNWRAASELEKRLPAAARSAFLAQLYAAEQVMWIGDEGVQLLGGHGFVRAHPVEQWYRDARTLSVLEGAFGV
ncbi:MAG: acyl-CoA dehydrogenase family protein [Hyphomonadaceae bacterium]